MAAHDITDADKLAAKEADVQPTVVTDVVPRPVATPRKKFWSKKTDAPASDVADKKAVAKGPTEPRVSYFQLYRYATGFDKFLIVMGIIAAMAHGVGLPLMTIIFANILGSWFTYNRAIPATADYLNDQAKQGCIYFVILAAALFALAYVQMSFWMWSGENQSKRVRQLYFAAILRQDIGWFDNTSTGELTTRMTSDTQQMQEGISEKVGLIIQFFTTFIAGFVIAFIKGWRLALVLTACLPLLVGAAAIMSIMVASSNESGNDAYAAAGGIAQQILSGMRTVVAFGGETRAAKRYAALLKSAEKDAIKKSIYAGLGVGMINFLIFAVYSMAFWYGGREMKAGRMLGQEVLNCFFALIIGAFSLGQGMPYFSAIGNAQGAAHKVYATIDRKSPIDASNPGGAKPKEVRGDIEFKNVSFHYPSRSDVPILKNFDLKVKAGQTVALVGTSGSGKSTIVKLVERFYNPVSGSVSLDGHELSDINVTWLRQQIGIVSQEPTLFDTTVRKNLYYGLKESHTTFPQEKLDAMVENACKVANAWDFIQKLPQGLDTPVGEAGSMMSGGQKQRIAIARAVMRDPQILLLDEATSALDTESERLVQAALESAAKGRTTIVIAHRLSTIKNADRIVVMSKGEIVEAGTHDELVAMKGAYNGLVEAQRLRGATNTHSEGDLEDALKEEASELQHDVKRATSIKRMGDQEVVVTLDGRPPAPARVESMDLKRRASVVSASKRRIAEEDKQKAWKEEQLKRKINTKRILMMNKPEFPIIAVAVFCSLLNGAVMPVFAVIFSKILAVFENTKDVDQRARDIDKWALGFFLLALASFVTNFLQIALLSIAGDKLTTRLRDMSFRALLRQEIAYFDEEDNSTGAITAKLASDAKLVQGLTGQTMAQILQLISNFGVGLGLAFSNSWQLTLVVLACVPLVGVGGYLQLRTLTGYGEQSRKAYKDANQTASEGIESIRTVQTLTQEGAFHGMYVDQIQVPHRMVVRGAFISSIGFASAEASIFLTYAVAFYYGSRLILWNTYSIEQVMITMFSIIFAAMAAGQISNFAPDAAKAKLAALAIFDILDRTPRIDAFSEEGQKPAKPVGQASTVQAEFSYPTRPDNQILRGLDIEALPGQTVALVGHSGCGKSTVLGLLERWYDVSGGSAQLDSLDVRQWNLRYLREQMALVGQEPILFDVSIRENIAYGARDGEATQDQIEAAARAANIHDFVMSLPQNYDTLVGEKGGQLSGGQKQRIAIARALIREPKLLLLDEATSALDSESEKVVQDALDRASRGRTTIVIAHRLSTIQNADRIYVLLAGKVSEMGTHQELVNKGGAYAELVGQQMLHEQTAE
ncbi:P-loop containing nucleoside triphosphate hydrolase protein [Phlyctochytrium arcticum]|nr:P-loop containing nucleoside triphosphate hydrolase protein [Phlyctochytrium arcticum]